MSPPPRRRRWRLALVGMVLVVLVGAYFGAAWWLPSVARVLDVSEKPRRVDALFVLGGGIEDRPFAAAAMFRAGLAPRIILAAIQDTSDSEDGVLPPEHEVTRRILMAEGVPESQIVTLPGPVNSTGDEADALAKFLEQEPECTVAIVTHAFHTRRCRSLFRRALGPRAGQVCFFAAPSSYFTDDDWWRSEDGFTVHALEYLKLVRYRAW